MNSSLLILEIAVASLALALLMADLWTPQHLKRYLGYAAASGTALILLGSFAWNPDPGSTAFNSMYVLDPLALYFKRFFLFAGVAVLLIGVEFSVEAKPVIGRMIERGLLGIIAGTNVVRFLPPLNITRAEVDEAVQKLGEALNDCGTK